MKLFFCGCAIYSLYTKNPRSRLRLADEASQEVVGEDGGSGRKLTGNEETFRWQASGSPKPSILPVTLVMAVIVLLYWLHSLLSIPPFE